jgi:hypothetical protein
MSKNKKKQNSIFDINFSEFPLAYLSGGKLPKGFSKTVYKYSDTIKGKNGLPITRDWTISANAKDEFVKSVDGKEVVEYEELGFGGPSTLQLIYELFQLWKEQGFETNKIYVGTYYHLLKRLGWGTGKSQYDQLKRTLRCLQGLTIEGKNSFFDPVTETYEKHLLFNPFPSVKIYGADSDKFSQDDYLYVTVDEVFFNTVKKNSVYYIPFDKYYFRSLTPMEQKIALMLAKVFSAYKKTPRYKWTRNVFKLANQIPILSKSKKAINQQLKRVCDGLMSKNFQFLSDYRFEDDNIIFMNKLQTTLDFSANDSEQGQKDIESIDWLTQEQLSICGDKHSERWYRLIAKQVPFEIIIRALSEAKADGHDVKKLYTQKIKEMGGKYLKPYISKSKNASQSNYEYPTISERVDRDAEEINQNKLSKQSTGESAVQRGSQSISAVKEVQAQEFISDKPLVGVPESPTEVKIEPSTEELIAKYRNNSLFIRVNGLFGSNRFSDKIAEWFSKSPHQCVQAAFDKTNDHLTKLEAFDSYNNLKPEKKFNYFESFLKTEIADFVPRTVEDMTSFE